MLKIQCTFVAKECSIVRIISDRSKCKCGYFHGINLNYSDFFVLFFLRGINWYSTNYSMHYFQNYVPRDKSHNKSYMTNLHTLFQVIYTKFSKEEPSRRPEALDVDNFKNWVWYFFSLRSDQNKEQPFWPSKGFGWVCPSIDGKRLSDWW